MRIHLHAIGKARRGPELELTQTYAARLNWEFQIREYDVKKKLSGLELRQAEAELLLGDVPPGAKIIALDEHGKHLSSRQFAEKIGSWRDMGEGDLVFMIGGADGHDPALLARADLKLSFGVMTWPHMMVRPLLVEQIFRAQSILSGHPYHRD